jgi:hypothetical protein
MLPAKYRWRSAALIAAFVALVAALLVLSGGDAGAHPGHPQKALFNGRWYQPTVMNLSTSKIDSAQLFQFCATPGCMAAWTGTIQASLNDWNAQPDTADFVVQGNYDINYDINTWVLDNATMTSFIGPGILGIAVPYDSNGDFCDPNTCTFWYGDAMVNHDLHAGAYGTAQSKQATMTHELGHLLSLCHESVQGDCHSSEGAVLECGTDDSGTVPFSIMSYDCIDPPAVGGSGIYLVQPFDVCGVNHAYPDGAFGFAGCLTPTPTPSPTPSPTPIAAGPNAWGNVDCGGGGISSVDALKLLRFGAGLTVSQTEPPPCPDIGTQHPIVLTHDQGDIDCSNTVNSVDALKLLRFTAALSVSQTQPCPIIGVDP